MLDLFLHRFEFATTVREGHGPATSTKCAIWFKFPDIQTVPKKNRVMLPSCPAASTQLQDLLHGSIKFLSFYQQTPRVLCPRGGFNIFTTFVLYIEVCEVEFRAPLEVEMSKECTRLWREACFEVKTVKN